MIPSELHRQMLRMLDGELSAAEATALEAELMANWEARAEWWKVSRIHSALESRFAAHAILQGVSVVPIDRVISLQRRRIVKIALTAAAAVFMFTAFVLWMITAPDNQPALATLRTAPESVISLTHAEERKNPGSHALQEGSRLTLEHGVAELELPHDVRAVIQAPATLTLIDSRSLRLDHGQAFFEVKSADGQGFTVVTPHQKIVDLGTAFGVIARCDREAVDLHVIGGRVRVDSPDGVAGEVISAGRSVRLEGVRISRELETAPSAFLRKLPEKVETLLADDFSTGLLADREYAVLIDPGAILGHSGKSFPGIADNDGWTFRTGSAAPANIPLHNPGFEDDGVKINRGAAIAHWHPASEREWGWGVDSCRSALAPTEGRFMGRVFGGRTLRQTTGETIRPGTTYILTLDVGLAESAATVRLLGSDSGVVLAEAMFQSTTEKWHRNQTLVFTADARHATGEALAISLACTSGSFATFDHIRLGTPGHDARDEIMLTATAPPEEEPDAPTPDTVPPRIIGLLPASDIASAAPGGPLMLRFDQPVTWGRGRIILRNITDWSETTFLASGPGLEIDDFTVTIHPPLELAEGETQMGRIAGWKSTGLAGRFRPASSDGHDSGNPRKRKSLNRVPIFATLDAAVPSPGIRREFGTIEPGHRYTASVALGHRDPAEFPGYTIRLVSGTTVLAERTGLTPPGPETVGLAWDSSELPEGISPGDPLAIEIAPAAGASAGHLDIEKVRVTAVAIGEAA